VTPNIAIVHVNYPHGPNFRLWLPLFLLWIPAILLAPFVLLTLWVVCMVFKVPFWRTVRVVWDVVCSLPGTNVRVCAEGKRITVRIL